MNEITFNCPNCSQSLETDENAAGMEFACPSCSMTVRVPDVALEPSSVPLQGDDARQAPDLEQVTALSCKNCGGQLDYSTGEDIATCLFCGSANVVRRAASQVERLRDLESGSLSVSYSQPTIAVKDAPSYIVRRIEGETAGFKNPDQLEMHAEGIYFPAWYIALSIQCTWKGEYSEQRTVIKVRKVTKRSGNHSYEVDEQYNDTETIWHPTSGSHIFATSLCVPAVAGFSSQQLSAVRVGFNSVGDHRGHPTSSPEIAVARPNKSQRESWAEFGCEERVNTQAFSECRSLVERLHHVSAVVTSKDFSLRYLPVAIVSYTANESAYRHFVNLRTGEFSGDIPLDHDIIEREAKKAGIAQQKLEATRWSVGILGLGGIAMLGTLMLDHQKPFEDEGWVGWLVGAVLAYLFCRPWAKPWASFLWLRRAYLLRLLLNPPPSLKIHSGDPQIVAQIEARFQKFAANNALEDLERTSIFPFLNLVGRALLRSVCPRALSRLPLFIIAPLLILLAFPTVWLVHLNNVEWDSSGHEAIEKRLAQSLPTSREAKKLGSPPSALALGAKVHPSSDATESASRNRSEGSWDPPSVPPIPGSVTTLSTRTGSDDLSSPDDIGRITFYRGDRVRLTRRVPMRFREEEYRFGNEGEQFMLLKFEKQSKRIYVLFKDGGGKEIALNLASTAVSLVSTAKEGTFSAVSMALRQNDLEKALMICNAAIQEASGEPNGDVITLQRNLVALTDVGQDVARAKAAFRQAAPQVANLRRNANVTDRPNPLRPNDTSAQDRARQMRANADQLEGESREKVTQAETHFQELRGELEQVLMR